MTILEKIQLLKAQVIKLQAHISAVENRLAGLDPNMILTNAYLIVDLGKLERVQNKANKLITELEAKHNERNAGTPKFLCE